MVRGDSFYTDSSSNSDEGPRMHNGVMGNKDSALIVLQTRDALQWLCTPP